MQDFDLSKPPNKNEPGVLAKLWRKIITENHFTSALGMLLVRYLKEQSDAMLKYPNIKRKNRATVITNVTATEMSIKTFFDLVFKFLKVKKLTITVKLTYHNGDESTHRVDVDGRNFQYDLDTDDTENIEEGVKDVQSRNSKKRV